VATTNDKKAPRSVKLRRKFWTFPPPEAMSRAQTIAAAANWEWLLRISAAGRNGLQFGVYPMQAAASSMGCGNCGEFLFRTGVPWFLQSSQSAIAGLHLLSCGITQVLRPD
jgi:hypothetical protein